MASKNLKRRVARVRLRPIGAAVALLTVALAATAAGGGGPAHAAAGEGLSYGARVKGEPLWLRLSGDRTNIANAEVAWTIPASKCSNRKRYRSLTAVGAEWDRYTGVVEGRFSERAIDRFRNGGVAYVEDFRISGTVSAEQVVGQFTVKVTAKRRQRTRFTCTYGPVPFTAVD